MKFNRQKSVSAGILLCCWLFLGCEKEVIVPDIEGNIVGYLYTFDEYGVCEDHGGVTVTTTGLDGSYTALSDGDGRYEFKSIPAGTYELVFTKEGFESEKLSGVKHLGGQPTILGSDQYRSIYRWTSLYKIPTSTIQNIYYENDSLVAEFNLTGTPLWSMSVMLYFSSQDGFQNHSAIIFSWPFVLKNGSFKSYFFRGNLPFEPGQTIYYKAAVLSRGHTSCATIDNDGNYIQCETGILLNPVLGNESEQFSMVFPQ